MGLMKDRSKPSILTLYPSCFYYPNWAGREQIKSSLWLLASYLSHHFPVEYADLELVIGRPNTAIQVRRFERRVRDYLAGKQFDILAISCWTSLCYKATMVTARAARELYPDRLIVVGGYHPTACPDDFITEDNVIDYIIRGEGELALTEIGRGFSAVGRPPETKIIVSPPLSSDQCVSVNWELIDDLVKREFPDGLNTLCVFLSRGCPFKCAFCMELIKERRWRAMPPDKAVEQVRIAGQRYRVIAVALGDACFGVQRSWRKRFFAGLADLAPAHWILMETRPDFIDEEDIRLLSKLKVQIQIGLESGSPRMLRIMNKTKQPDRYLAKFRKISHLLSEYNVVHGANLIFNHPGETEESVKETIAFVDQELARGKSSLIWACHEYSHFPGSEIDGNRRFYEEKYGSQFLSPRWWHEDEDQFEGGRKVIPSHDLTGERRKIWSKMIAEREPRFRDNLSPIAFHIAADTYWPDWRNDPRYKETEL